MSPSQHLLSACAALACLTFLVALRMLYVRISEMRRKRIPAQAVALSAQKSERLDDTRASDNYANLFELPVLFYAFCAVAMASATIPTWIPALAWTFVALRVVHSLIQCSYNRVMHRFTVFITSFVVLVAMWVGYLLDIFRG